jgi:hypothetical protein
MVPFITTPFSQTVAHIYFRHKTFRTFLIIQKFIKSSTVSIINFKVFIEVEKNIYQQILRKYFLPKFLIYYKSKILKIGFCPKEKIIHFTYLLLCSIHIQEENYNTCLEVYFDIRLIIALLLF